MVQVQICEFALHFGFKIVSDIDGMDKSTYRKSFERMQYRDMMG